MFDANRERHLLIGTLVESDAGGGAAKRAAPVRADYERGDQTSAALERNSNRIANRLNRRDFVFDHAQIGERAGECLERRH